MSDVKKKWLFYLHIALPVSLGQLICITLKPDVKYKTWLISRTWDWFQACCQANLKWPSLLDFWSSWCKTWWVGPFYDSKVVICINKMKNKCSKYVDSLVVSENVIWIMDIFILHQTYYTYRNGPQWQVALSMSIGDYFTCEIRANRKVNHNGNH